MPYLNVRLATEKSSKLAIEVKTLLLDLVVKDLGKDSAVAAIDLQFADPTEWFVAGKALADSQKSSFYIEVKVTTGTNTRGQKGQFIADVNAGMQKLLTNATPTSYVVVQDVAPDDWGFGGQTQGKRYYTVG